ncbi:MAG: glycosyltransferase family 9 protein [Alistipes sp.]|nr:glycosyltransferase family 9 protein [Alistipes sp.]
MEQENSLPRHILIIRISAIGDVAMLPHTIRAFSAEHPEVKLTIATQRFLRPFFRGLNVDFLDIDTKGEHRDFKGIVRLTKQIRELGVDAIADMHGVIRSYQIGLLARLMGIRVATIDKGRVEKWFRLGYSKSNAISLKHTVVRYSDVLRRLGFEFADPTPIAEKPAYDNPLGKKDGLWVGFAPFSAHEGKTYPANMREEVVRLLSERYDRVFVHSGGREAELSFAKDMEERYHNVTALFPICKLEQEVALISHLDCIVSMDSMAMHIASLVATPVVSIWGATHPEFGFSGFGSREDLMLQIELPCRPCSVYGKKPCKYGDYRCMRAITPQMIANKVAEVVKKQSEGQE